MKLPGGLNLQQMMQQAQKMQEDMAREMEALRVSASAGGGMEMLEDLLVAALNECGRKVDQGMQSRIGSALGGLNLPGLT